MKILICDDDEGYAKACRKKLQKLAELHQVHLEIQIVESGEKLLFFIDSKYAKVDCIYMDYHMPGISGMETAKMLRQKGMVTDIVFCSADSSHILEAFDVDAMYYIEKSKISDEKFEAVFLKAVERSKKRAADILPFSYAGEHRNVPLDQIVYFEVQNRIVTVHYCENGSMNSFEFYSRISKIEEALYGRGFIRIHRAYLVAEKYVQRRTQKEVRLLTGQVLPVGKTHRIAE